MTARASIKELLAASKLGEAAGAAMCPEMLQVPKKAGGQEMAAEEAERTAALVSLGRKAVIFHHGGSVHERAGAIDELLPMLERARNRHGRRIVHFAEVVTRCVAAVALEELRADKCTVCHGKGQIQVANVEGRQPTTMCPKCSGGLLRRFNEDERIGRLAREWLAMCPADPEDKTAVSEVAKELRKHSRLRELLFAIDYAKGKLLEAERVVTEQSEKMVERWGRP